MKKIILFIAVTLIPILSNAQSFFDQLEDMDNVDMVVITKDAFEILSKFENVQIENNEGMQIFKIIRDLNEFKMFSTKDVAIASKMDAMSKTAIKKQKLTELMRVKDEDSRIKIYVKATKNKDYVSEVLMFINDVEKNSTKKTEAVIVSLTGNIDVNKISELTDTFVNESNKK
ncbi:DUF4252 domain-containing protein [Polaribacter sp. HL-MS24]|uniref:DUF4252 domain-containing protein n=1 Tax=Polaribacter sp. HL-MS24 TaxID=3077735 RepID=UPI002934890B|nr:DUF4252 domain-containing protein [Polaribacter sp. HL-MS24]WOC40098.1 DUF4252 domain-containing protein [Polaribacter sp. HL-MS24]